MGNELEVDEYQNLLDQYLESIPSKILKIQEAYEKKEWDVFKDLVHKLSGSSGMYELENINSYASNLEVAIVAKDYAEVDIQMKKLMTLIP